MTPAAAMRAALAADPTCRLSDPRWVKPPGDRGGWVCDCACGRTTLPLPTAGLLAGRTRSCGCLRAAAEARPAPGPGGGCGGCDPAAPPGAVRFCSPACRQAALNARRQAARGPRPAGACRTCGGGFTAGKRTARAAYCSAACRSAAHAPPHRRGAGLAFDPAAGVLRVGRRRVRLADVLAALAGPDRPPPADLPGAVLVQRVRLHPGEHAALLAHARRAGADPGELARRALVAAGLTAGPPEAGPPPAG